MTLVVLCPVSYLSYLNLRDIQIVIILTYIDISEVSKFPFLF